MYIYLLQTLWQTYFSYPQCMWLIDLLEYILFWFGWITCGSAGYEIDVVPCNIFQVTSGSDWPMCHFAVGTGAPFGDSKWAPDRTHLWIAKKQLFNFGFVKLVKSKMARFSEPLNDWFEISYSVIEREKFYTSKYIYILFWLNTGWQKLILAARACILCNAKSLISFQQKYFVKMVRYTVKKMLSKPLYFAQKRPQNAGNCRFRDLKFKKFPEGRAPGPPYGNVLLLYREGPCNPSFRKWQGP